MNIPNSSFILGNTPRILVGSSPQEIFQSIDDAIYALKAGKVSFVVGAFPFERSHPTALMTPYQWKWIDTFPLPSSSLLPQIENTHEIPELPYYREKIHAIIQQLRNPDNPLIKVVLARKIEITFSSPLDPYLLLWRLVQADRYSTGYYVDLHQVLPNYPKRFLIGTSPELLISRRGDHITLRPFAGSAPRSANPIQDRTNARTLYISQKNCYEHQLVIDQLRLLLKPFSQEIHISAHPKLAHTATMWHLYSVITATLRTPNLSSLQIARILHPTAAVGGIPTANAVKIITQSEQDRGFYAGAVGWCDDTGNGCWMVSIRCIQLDAQCTHGLAHGGGGLVADSDPDQECEETTAKLKTIFSALKNEKES